MKIQTHVKRIFCLIGLMLAASIAYPQTADWPTRPVRLLVPAGAGSVPDTMARLIGDRLAQIWGQSVVVENKVGAGGLIGLTTAKMEAQGRHTLVLAPASTLVVTPFMYRSANVDIVRDFAPVALIGLGTMMIAVRADSPIGSLSELLKQARAEPGRFSVATTSMYSLPHLAVGILSQAAGVPIHTVTFNSSSQGVQSVINGDTQVMVDGTPAIDPMIRGKRMKPIAVFTQGRAANRPDVPAVAEQFPALVLNGWHGVVAPADMPAAVIARVNRDIGTVLAMPEVVERLAAVGITSRNMSPGEFGTYWTTERARWEKALGDMGAKPRAAE
ncbi:MAG: Bug family tripartite tricarboxylate transporter substrate binding protein [Burkholderiaceae bacterium]